MILNDYNEIIEKKLSEIYQDKDKIFSRLLEAMDYSLLAGGKRIRPALLMEFYRVCGGNGDCSDFASAIEMIHTYSLIHDDLPCMDNDDYRRGRPSCHRQFDEATALLAGDGLLTGAFQIASRSQLDAEYKLKAINILADCAGAYGMIGGQAIDLMYENKAADLDVVLQMYRLKTSALLVAASKIGCVLAGAGEDFIDAAAAYAENLGLAFQITDDILDTEGNAEKLGKPVGSDSKNNKSTFVSLNGMERSKSDVKSYTQKAMEALEIFGHRADGLRELAEFLINRDY